MSKHTFTLGEKFGVWSAFNGACFWCGTPIEFVHVTIDHVLPETLPVDPVKWQETLWYFGLPNTFSVNSFENWVPAHGSCNSKKSARVFPVAPAMIAALDYVARRAPTARAACERVTREKDKAKVLTAIGDALEKGVLTRAEVEAMFVGLPDPLPLHLAEASGNEARQEEKFVLHLSPEWSVVRVPHHGSSIAYVTDGKRVGYTTTAPRPHSSMLCPTCGQPGPWNGILCLSCNSRSDPADD